MKIFQQRLKKLEQQERKPEAIITPRWEITTEQALQKFDILAACMSELQLVELIRGTANETNR